MMPLSAVFSSFLACQSVFQVLPLFASLFTALLLHLILPLPSYQTAKLFCFYIFSVGIRRMLSYLALPPTQFLLWPIANLFG